MAKRKSIAKRARTRKTKKVKRPKTVPFLRDMYPVTSLAAGIVLATLLYFYLSGSLGGQNQTPVRDSTSTTTTVPIYPRGECGDLRLSVDTVIEATEYHRYGIPSIATEGNKFVIMKITATNDADTRQDFSGYRMELTAGGETYIPRIFNHIDQVTLLDDTTPDYACDELALAHMSRFELNPHQTVTGCKMFRIVRTAKAESISIYGLEGLECDITV
jgi:hypothetical protein